MAHSWPLDLPETGPDGRPHPSYTPSDIDVEMSAGEEAQYLSRLEEALAQLATRPYPDIAYVVGGVDPYEHDKLPSAEELKLTIDELAARDRTVFDFLAERKIPQAWLMAGGYGDRAWEPYVPFLAYALSRTL
jgi:acetoin utilization deacetylase AcuC-like enzyme